MTQPSPVLPAEQPLHSYERYFDVFRADTPRLLREAHRLRYQVYCVERRFEDAAQHPDGLETDEYDHRSVHTLLVCRPTGATTGTVRLVLPDGKSRARDLGIECPGTVRLVLPNSGNGGPELPIQKVCSRLSVWDDRLLPAATTAEISRFAVSRDFRRRLGEDRATFADAGPSEQRNAMAGGIDKVMPHIALGLMLGLAHMSVDHGITHWCAVMEPMLLRLLRRLGIDFTPLGPKVAYHGWRQPCYRSLVDLSADIRRKRPDVWEVLTDHGRLLDRLLEYAGPPE